MHLRPRVVVVATLALVACGSGAGSLDGKVQGHDISVKEAVFLDFGNNQVLLAAGNEDHVCEVITGYAAAGTGFVVLETLLANWNGTAPDPVLEGTYVQAASFSAPGLYSLTLVQWGDRCIAYGTLGATSGSVRIESFGGLKDGAHLIADVDLKFGEEHLSGRIDAHYCQAPGSRGTACSH
jgi:hypothetical protein